MENITEPARKTSVAYDVDVVVAGGGIAGVFAALAAAENGASTVLVERFGTLGGNYGPGLAVRHDLWQHPALHKRGLGGVAGKLLQRLEELGGLTTFPFTGGGDSKDWSWPGIGGLPIIDIQTFMYVTFQMMKEAGVTLLLSTHVSGPIMEGQHVRGLFVENKSGRQAVRAKVVIDTTGESDVAAAAGAPCVATHDRQASGTGLFFEVDGVDWPKYEANRKEGKAKTLSEDDQRWVEEVLFKAVGFPWANYPKDILPQIRRAWDSGEYEYIRKLDDLATAYMIPFGVHAQNITTMECGIGTSVNPVDAEHLARLEADLRVHIFDTMQFMKKCVPGFGRASLRQIGPLLACRYGRCVETEYILTADDIWDSRKFPDVVHALTTLKKKEGGLVDLEHGVDGTLHELPYRCLLAQKVEGLLAAGRNINVLNLSRLRARWITMLTGAVAGTAAALSAAEDISPRALDAGKLQARLVADGFYLGDDARLKELGLEGIAADV